VAHGLSQPPRERTASLFALLFRQFKNPVAYAVTDVVTPCQKRMAVHHGQSAGAGGFNRSADHHRV
jgi:hypothetical protein